MEEDKIIHIFWFRRDLRFTDNHGLYRALSSGLPVLPIFIFDITILEHLESDDKRVEFIWRELKDLNAKLAEYKSAIQFYFDRPLDAFKKLINKYRIHTVFTNEDYEPYGMSRDEKIAEFLNKKGIHMRLFKDHVIFKPDEVLKADGTPYTIYTPYKNKWREIFNQNTLPGYPSESLLKHFMQVGPTAIAGLDQIGFTSSSFTFPAKIVYSNIIKNYAQTRDLPYLDNGTSKLGLHLRFGTLSIRTLVNRVAMHETFVNELIWREFFMQILFHFPYVANRSFKPKYDQIEWENDETNFEAWCNGLTGYPLVDAGMRELNQTGHMHNRVRMVVASFLCKHLLIDWRWGEAYFAQKLLDFELASNNGNWQWAAGTGCDAAPYFRIFNPKAQLAKFDPGMRYVHKWVDLTKPYPKEIIDHAWARERALKVYKAGLEGI